jgi:uncharacterized protein (TIGR03067 family)
VLHKLKIGALGVAALGLIIAAGAGGAAGRHGKDDPAADRAPTAAEGRADREEIQGTWEVLAIEANGKVEEVRPARRTLEITADELIGGDRYRMIARYRIVRDREPKGIDLMMEMDSSPVKVPILLRGIYRLRGDRLDICLAAGDQERPKAFVSPDGAGHRLLHLQRGKVPPNDPPAKPEPDPDAEREGLADEIDDTRARLELEEIELDAMKATIKSLMEQVGDPKDRQDEVRSPQQREALKELEALREREARTLKRLAEQKDDYLRRRQQLNRKRRQLERLERQLEALGPAPTSGPRKVRVGDVLVIDVLEALPARPLNGERIVRSDGTISLDFYGDLKVVGLDRHEAKVKLIEHLKKYLADDILGLVGENPETHEKIAIPPIDSDRIFIDDSPNEARKPESKTVEEKLDRVLDVFNAIRREQNLKGPAGP